MATAKQDALKLIERLPDDCTFEDLQQHLNVAAKVRRAEQSLQQDGGVQHEEVRQRFARWLQN